MKKAASVLVIAVAFLPGCASAPVEQLAASEAAIEAAARAGATPSDLALAREKLALTRRWLDAADFKPARWLAEQAQVDAELASIRAQGARRQ